MGCGFNVDDLDFFIISEILQGNKRSWEITKKYFKLEKAGRRRIDPKHVKLKKRLKKMSLWGIVHISKEEDGWKNKYAIIKNHAKIGKHKFSDGYFNSIQLKINSSWVIFQYPN